MIPVTIIRFLFRNETWSFFNKFCKVEITKLNDNMFLWVVYSIDGEIIYNKEATKEELIKLALDTTVNNIENSLFFFMRVQSKNNPAFFGGKEIKSEGNVSTERDYRK